MNELDYIQKRLVGLEKRCRLLIVVCLGLGLFLAFLFIAIRHQVLMIGSGDVISARGFVVVDEDEKIRCELGVSPSNSGLTLYDREGRERIRVELARGASEEKPRVMIFDPPMALRSVLGSYVVHLGTEDVVFDRPAASLVFYGPDHEVLWKAPEEPWVNTAPDRSPGP